MECPELPPGSPLDPGWTDGYRHREAGPFRHGGLNVQRARAILFDNRELMEQNAVAQVLRDERINLWRDLWNEAKSKDDTIDALRRRIEELEAELETLR